MYLRCLPGEDYSDKVVVYEGPLALAKAAWVGNKSRTRGAYKAGAISLGFKKHLCIIVMTTDG